MKSIKNRTILIVDDEPAILQMCQSILEENNFSHILTANNSCTALNQLKYSPEIAVLDVMLPDMDGFILAKTIHKQIKIPFLFLTAKGEPDDRLKGFSIGADDYIVKPFLAQEFVYRIIAVLRRTYNEKEDISFNLDACKVNLGQASVEKEGTTISLTAKEVDILGKLYANAGMIVSTKTLCQTSCGDNYFGYENTLMSHIRHIREKIEHDPSSPISLITIRGLGYKLILKE